jgi:hypothetical protein
VAPAPHRVDSRAAAETDHPRPAVASRAVQRERDGSGEVLLPCPFGHRRHAVLHAGPLADRRGGGRPLFCLPISNPPSSPLLLCWMREKRFIYTEEGTYMYMLHHSNAPLACTRVPRTYAACAGRFGRDRCGASHIVPHIDCPAPYMYREGGYVGCRVCLCCSCLQCC